MRCNKKHYFDNKLTSTGGIKQLNYKLGYQALVFMLECSMISVVVKHALVSLKPPCSLEYYVKTYLSTGSIYLKSFGNRSESAPANKRLCD